MSHKPIQFINCSLSFQGKICFEDFNTQIFYGNRIAIIGKNGSGKTCLLKMIAGICEPTDGIIHLPEEKRIGYVPQTITDFEFASGGERLNLALTKALSINPDILLLDEPSNHLDMKNRQSLFRFLISFTGTLIIVSHDPEVLRNCVDTLWYFDRGMIRVFKGDYDDLNREEEKKRELIQMELEDLKHQKKKIHHNLMREQERASKSRHTGEKNVARKKGALIQMHTQRSYAQETSGKKKMELKDKKNILLKKLSEIPVHDIIKPHFSLNSLKTGDRIILSLSGASAGYGENLVLKNMLLSVSSKSRIALTENNGSGKTTLLRGILNDPKIKKTGTWFLPEITEIGYLDQHYATVCPEFSVLENIQKIVPNWTYIQIRNHLNCFLFRKNDEVNKKVSFLSGGEKARLSLALIGAKPPALLLLDEVTNNLDLETKKHVIQVLVEYPGAMIVVSHDEEFLEGIGIKEIYEIQNNQLQRK